MINQPRKTSNIVKRVDDVEEAIPDFYGPQKDAPIEEIKKRRYVVCHRTTKDNSRKCSRRKDEASRDSKLFTTAQGYQTQLRRIKIWLLLPTSDPSTEKIG